ncbi:hypothetical protein ACPPVO_35475 [Dactylosporangium sp. McL0621]|uniref:hypothetical protein n=1 Tax=Dactylosporangium sp. McL0621 TaxID=3415678 RepID=UPI003CEDE02C
MRPRTRARHHRRPQPVQGSSPGRYRWRSLLLRHRAAAAGRLVAALAGSLVGLVALPIVLWQVQSVLWERTDWRALLASPMSVVTVVFAVVGAGWTGWLWLLGATIHDISAALRRRPMRRRLPASLSGLAGGVATVIAVLGQPSAASAAVPAAVPPVAAGLEPIGLGLPIALDATAVPGTASSLSAAAPVVTAATGTRPGATVSYEVRRGDWLGAISDRFLGDFNRYPELQQLNPDLIPDAAGRHGPNHIETGWRLTLPADAHDRGSRRHAVGLATSADRTVTNDGTGTTGNGDTGQTDGATPPPSATQAPNTAPSRVPAPTTASPAIPAGNGAPAPARHTGGRLPGGWFGLPIIAAVAAALIWLRHRPAHRPAGPGAAAHGRPTPAPASRPDPGPITDGEGADHNPDAHAATAVPQPAEHPDAVGVPGTPPPVAGVRALTGPGAHGAARGLFVSALTTPRGSAGAQAVGVVVPADTLAELFAADAAQVAADPRLHVAASLPEALAYLETLLIHRYRHLREHDTGRPDEPEAAAQHPPHARVLLLTHPPRPETDLRMRAILRLGVPVQIAATVLGPWPGGEPWTVYPDGTTDRPGQHLLVADLPTTRRLLAAAPAPAAPSAEHTAVTGTPPVSPAHEPHPAPPQQTADTTDTTPDPPAAVQPGPDIQPPAATASADRPPAQAPDPHDLPLRLPVRIRVLGEPVVLDPDGRPITGMRQHARELLVYLAVHRDGANLTDIMEVLWPTATLSRAAQRLSTDTADLRRRIREAAGQPRRTPGRGPTAGKPTIEPVVNTSSRYHLNPDVVDIDLWRLDDALRTAAAATDPHIRLQQLHVAAGIPAEALAAGQGYDWIDQHREHTRRQQIRARVRLADLLAAADPPATAELLENAADLDPGHEALARRAMRALAATGGTAAIAARLERLRAALAAIGERPTSDTIALAADLGTTSGTHPPAANAAHTAPSCTRQTGADT